MIYLGIYCVDGRQKARSSQIYCWMVFLHCVQSGGYFVLHLGGGSCGVFLWCFSYQTVALWKTATYFWGLKICVNRSIFCFFRARSSGAVFCSMKQFILLWFCLSGKYVLKMSREYSFSSFSDSLWNIDLLQQLLIGILFLRWFVQCFKQYHVQMLSK